MAVVVAVPRLVATLHSKERLVLSELRTTMQAELILPAECANHSWNNVFTGSGTRCQAGGLTATMLFADCPVALLHSGRQPDQHCTPLETHRASAGTTVAYSPSFVTTTSANAFDNTDSIPTCSVVTTEASFVQPRRFAARTRSLS